MLHLQSAGALQQAAQVSDQASGDDNQRRSEDTSVSEVEAGQAFEKEGERGKEESPDRRARADQGNEVENEAVLAVSNAGVWGENYDYLTMEIEGAGENLLVDDVQYRILVSGLSHDPRTAMLLM